MSIPGELQTAHAPPRPSISNHHDRVTITPSETEGTPYPAATSRPPMLQRLRSKFDGECYDFPWCIVVSGVIAASIFVFFIIAGSLSKSHGSCYYTSYNRSGKISSTDVGLWTIIQGAAPLAGAIFGPLIYLAISGCHEQAASKLSIGFSGGCLSVYMIGMVTQFTALARKVFHLFLLSTSE
eukprot:TRINITY_DN5060_c0_g1_i1.p1 TRINITY_DN5060_c0_g1~~TRINITY_DN5060_c0_g1_i1.p1  ORF type:complete len:182 (+),score=31.99 TRINITY_DN5060_c0_g1_i1:63-608(+)